jgi:hypothetical protein
MCPRIVAAIDNLAAEGDVPARFEFLVEAAREYGAEILCLTALPWITVIEPPGEAKLLSPQMFKELVASRTEVLIGFGLAPWSVNRRTRTRFPDASLNALVVPVSNAGQPQFGSYRDHDATTWAPLSEHFGVDYPSPLEYRLVRTALLHAVLQLVATAWNMDVEDFTTGQWCRTKTDNICGHLKRRSLIELTRDASIT